MEEFKWYIVHTYSGFEQRVKKNLEERIKAKGQQKYFKQILVPTEQVIEIKKGKRRHLQGDFSQDIFLFR